MSGESVAKYPLRVASCERESNLHPTSSLICRRTQIKELVKLKKTSSETDFSIFNSESLLSSPVLLLPLLRPLHRQNRELGVLGNNLHFWLCWNGSWLLGPRIAFIYSQTAITSSSMIWVTWVYVQPFSLDPGLDKRCTACALGRVTARSKAQSLPRWLR